MALKKENREKLKLKKEKDNALQKIRDQNKENEVFSMRLGSAIDELFQVKLLSGSKDKEIISLKEEIKNLQMTLEQENPEKLKVNERNTKDQVSSEVINNQEKEIKRLKVSLDQEKEQNEGFLKEITYLKDLEAKKDKEVLKAKAKKSALIEKNAALWEANEKNEQEKIQHLNQIESLRYELVNETKHLKDELEHAHYDINIQYAEVTFLKKEVKRLDDSLSKAMNQGKSNVQEIAKHVIVIERLKSELAREMNNSRCDGILHEKKGQMINLDDIKIKVDEFNRMKDMIRNNLEVNCLNVTFEVNNS